MLAWIKRNKYLLGFLIAVIAVSYTHLDVYKRQTLNNTVVTLG